MQQTKTIVPRPPPFAFCLRVRRDIVRRRRSESEVARKRGKIIVSLILPQTQLVHYNPTRVAAAIMGHIKKFREKEISLDNYSSG